jgi:PEP-CTERM motif
MLCGYFIRRRGKAWSFEFFRFYDPLTSRGLACSRTSGQNSGTYATSGTQYFLAEGNLNTTLRFSAPVAGFGIYVTDLSDGFTPPDQISLVLTLANNTTQTVTTSIGSNNNNANVLFFGAISNDPTNPITAVQLLNADPTQTDYIGIDDVTIGQLPVSTPEPASMTLLSFGIAGMAGFGWRRRKQTIRV